MVWYCIDCKKDVDVQSEIVIKKLYDKDTPIEKMDLEFEHAQRLKVRCGECDSFDVEWREEDEELPPVNNVKDVKVKGKKG